MGAGDDTGNWKRLEDPHGGGVDADWSNRSPSYRHGYAHECASVAYQYVGSFWMFDKSAYDVLAVLTKLGYLIDNPWNNALDRARSA